MPHSKPKLEDIKIASPCSVDWNSMSGDERVRFCDQCRLNVYNLSGMTRKEAEEVISQKEGRLCVMFFKKKDGTIITQDCPVGLRALRRAKAAAAAVFAAALGILSILGMRRQALKNKSAVCSSSVEIMGDFQGNTGGISLPELGRVPVRPENHPRETKGKIASTSGER